MALKLITAPPGTGKTLLLIKMIFEYLKEGRRVYSNIDQLKIEEVLPFPHNGDWRDFPDGSVVIIDEAQEHVAFSKRDLINFERFEEPARLLKPKIVQKTVVEGSVVRVVEETVFEEEPITAYKERIRQAKASHDVRKANYLREIEDIASSLQVHRHFGFDIILATQAGSLLNSLTLDIVGEHYHLTRPFGFKGNMLFFWRRYVSNPNSSAERNCVEWKKAISFKKSYFHLYRSANVHTHKTSVPLKYIAFFLAIPLTLFLSYYMFSSSKAFSTMQGKKTEEQTLQIKDVAVNKEMPSTPEQLAAFNEEQRLKLEAEQQQQQQEQQKQIAAQQQLQEEKEREQEISGCVQFNGKYTAFDEYGRPIHNKSHLCKQVIQDADRNVMKKPSRRSQQSTNVYSTEAEQQLEQSRIFEKQKQVFDDNSDLYRVGGVPTN